MSTSVNVPPPDAMMAPVQGSGKPTKPYAPKNNPPSQTLYVNNLNEKLKKEDVKKGLYGLFSSFGTILDIVVVKTMKMRGQAFVVFSNLTEATEAMKQLQNFPFYGKPMRLGYAKGKSDAIAKLDGTYVAPLTRKAMRCMRIVGFMSRIVKEEAKKLLETQGAQVMVPAQQMQQAIPVQMPAQQVPQAQMVENTVPNSTLFLQGLPHDIAQKDLAVLFKGFPGFKEVRLVAARPGIAFVEYEAEVQAGTAMAGLKNYKLDDAHTMMVTYAKK